MGKIDNQKSCSRTFGWSCTTSWTLGARRHGTAFNFAVFHAGNQIDVLESYFNVRGEQRHGLLIDPGAASGLIGSDTLKQLMDHCITPFGKQHEVSINYSKTTPVSGISGEATRLWEKSPSLYKLAATPSCTQPMSLVALALLARHCLATQHYVALMPVSLPTGLQMEMD